MDLTWKLISETPYKAGYRKMLKRVYQLPSGIEKDYDIVDAGRSAVVVPVTGDKTVIMIKVFRPAQDKVLMEFPGGYIEKGEDPAVGASRELAEETGYMGDLSFLSTNYIDAYSTTLRYNYIALNCRLVGERNPEDDEVDTEIIELSFDELVKHIKSGELTNPEAGYMAMRFLNI